MFVVVVLSVNDIASVSVRLLPPDEDSVPFYKSERFVYKNKEGSEILLINLPTHV